MGNVTEKEENQSFDTLINENPSLNVLSEANWAVANNNVISEKRALVAEHAVLGSLLIDADKIAPALFSTVKASDFTYKENQMIFLAARTLFREGKPIDGVTVRGALTAASVLQETDVSAYLVQLMEVTPTSANWREYAAIMREQSTLVKIRNLGYALTSSTSLDDCRPIVAELSDALSARSGVKVYTGEDLIESFLNYLGDASENPNAGVEYVRYGFPALDDGIFTELGDVVVIGGYPSDGKTALALNLAWRMAQKFKVCFFSLETNVQKIRDRWASYALPFDFNKVKRLRYNPLSGSDWEQIAGNVTTLSRYGDGKAKFNFNVIEAAGMSASDIQSISRAYGFQVIFIDYIQEVEPDTRRRYGTRNDELAAISRSMHIFAQSTKTAVFELSQLNRSNSNTGNAKKRDPHLDSLRESGQLEQDADAVFLLYRQSPDDPSDAQRILRIAKNKEGRLGSFYLDFDTSTQTFTLSDKKRTNAARDYSAAGRAAKQSYRAAAYDNPPPLFDNDDNFDLPF